MIRKLRVWLVRKLVGQDGVVMNCRINDPETKTALWMQTVLVFENVYVRYDPQKPAKDLCGVCGLPFKNRTHIHDCTIENSGDVGFVIRGEESP